MFEVLTKLLQTHSLTYATAVAYKTKVFFNRSQIKTDTSIGLDHVATVNDSLPVSYWAYIQPLLKRMAKRDNSSVICEDLKAFLKLPTQWEEKRGGSYFKLITNDPEHGALTEQELFSTQQSVNTSFEKGIINFDQYSLMWFFIGTGLRPVQIARMKVKDVKIYDGPEGKEVILYVPLAKGIKTAEQEKWRRRCPSVLAEILIERLKIIGQEESQPLFKKRADQIRWAVKSISEKLKVHSERTDNTLNLFPYRFRYTLGTRALALGGSDAEVARLLTHRSTDCIKHYRASMPHLQKPIKDALSGEMSIIASAFKGRLIADINDATRKGEIDALIRDFVHLNGEAIGACGTQAKCYQHAPRACLTCTKFEPFECAPWDDLLNNLKEDMDGEKEDKIKLITLTQIEAVKSIQSKCKKKKRGNTI